MCAQILGKITHFAVLRSKVSEHGGECASCIVHYARAPLELYQNEAKTPASNFGLHNPMDRQAIGELRRKEWSMAPLKLTARFVYWEEGVNKAVDRRKGGKDAPLEIEAHRQLPVVEARPTNGAGQLVESWKWDTEKTIDRKRESGRPSSMFLEQTVFFLGQVGREDEFKELGEKALTVKDVTTPEAGITANKGFFFSKGAAPLILGGAGLYVLRYRVRKLHPADGDKCWNRVTEEVSESWPSSELYVTVKPGTPVRLSIELGQPTDLGQPIELGQKKAVLGEPAVFYVTFLDSASDDANICRIDKNELNSCLQNQKENLQSQPFIVSSDSGYPLLVLLVFDVSSDVKFDRLKNEAKDSCRRGFQLTVGFLNPSEEAKRNGIFKRSRAAKCELLFQFHGLGFGVLEGS